MEESKLVIRPAELTDKEFILANWLKYQRSGSGYFKSIPSQIYFENYGNKVKEILCRASTQISVASQPGEKLWAAGYSVYDADQIYWVYVKPEFRRQKIASLLIKDKDIKVVKSATFDAWPIIDSKHLVFNPF